jgi:hypothetical protein
MHLALDEGEWLASCPCHFTPRVRAPGTHWTAGCVGPRASLDMVSKEQILNFPSMNAYMDKGKQLIAQL